MIVESLNLPSAAHAEAFLCAIRWITEIFTKHHVLYVNLQSIVFPSSCR
jgi:hypothetical protein